MERRQRRERRDDGLTTERIVAAAIEILDGQGEAALTFRALATVLQTGPGAIYWHVSNKAELMAAAVEAVLTPALYPDNGGDPADAIRATALGIFDAMDRHPWVGSQLYRDPTQSAILRTMEAIGAPMMRMKIAESMRFNAGTALFNYIVGAGVQNAANGQVAAAERARGDFMDTTRRRWAEMDPEQYPFVSSIVPQLLDHDDRAQFLAGVDLILAGVASA